LPSARVRTPASRSSLTNRSSNVLCARSTRPLAWLELAQMMSSSRLPGHEGAWSAARTPDWQWRGALPRRRVAVDLPDTRWCSDVFEIGCDNGEKVRIAFALDCCDREAISWVATTGAINSRDIRDLMVESVERRLGLVDKLPKSIEWLRTNGSPYSAGETRSLARAIGLMPCTTPVESPQSNGMGRSFVKLIKRDYARGQRKTRRGQCAVPARFLVRALQRPGLHPHKALDYRSPREFRKSILETMTETASALWIASRPQPWQLWTTPDNQSLFAYSGAISSPSAAAAANCPLPWRSSSRPNVAITGWRNYSPIRRLSTICR